MNSMVGLTPKTIKLKGEVLGREVVVLIDPRATHNFISRKLVKVLALPLDEIELYGVLLGMGSPLKAKTFVRGWFSSCKEYTSSRITCLWILGDLT